MENLVSGTGKSIDKFIREKRELLEVTPTLTAHDRLVTIDGPDGSGKSTIAKKVFEILSEKYGHGNVILVDITNIKGSPSQEKLKSILRRMSPIIKKRRENTFYASGVNRAYKEIVLPAINCGKIVVVDRSELDLIRYAIQSGDEAEIKRRVKYLEDGTFTHNIISGNRVMISVRPNDILANIKNRGNMSVYDPRCEDDVRSLITAQSDAEEIISKLNIRGDVNIIKLENQRTNDSEKQDQVLRLSNEIVSKLKFNWAHR